MKVLFITHVTTLAGANRSMLQLIKELKDNYHVESVLLAPFTDRSKGTIQHALEELKTPVINIDIQFFKQGYTSYRVFYRYVHYLWKLRNLYKQLQPYHFDIIHSNSSVIDIGGYLSKKLKVKHVWHLREFGEEDYSLRSIGGQLYERYTYRHADAFIAISNAVANHFKGTINSKKIHTIYNGIFIADDIPMATHQNEVIHFFCAGILSEVKNQKEIVLAMDELVNVRNVKQIHLTLVGIAYPYYVEELRAIIKEKKLKNYIDILPETDGIQSLASKMDVGLMVSRAEAFGRVTIEYQLQNLLVIANDAGANLELIEDGVTGLIYKAGNIQQLADKMALVVTDPQRMWKIAEVGMNNAKIKFSSNNNTESIYHLYTQLLSNSQADH